MDQHVVTTMMQKVGVSNCKETVFKCLKVSLLFPSCKLSSFSSPLYFPLSVTFRREYTYDSGGSFITTAKALVITDPLEVLI